MAYTLATLEVSRATYEDIAVRLKEAGYSYLCDGDMIDMTHIGIVIEEEPSTEQKNVD